MIAAIKHFEYILGGRVPFIKATCMKTLVLEYMWEMTCYHVVFIVPHFIGKSFLNYYAIDGVSVESLLPRGSVACALCVRSVGHVCLSKNRKTLWGL